MADDNDKGMVDVPIPGEENEAERERGSVRRTIAIRNWSAKGKPSRHNRGYDQAADGSAAEPDVENVIDED